MSKAPEDIIELTDIIERGPNAPKDDATGSGVDLSFERELEDLFADEPQAATSTDPDLPDFGSLDLPPDSFKDSPKDAPAGDIDLDGLDALLGDADTSAPGSLGGIPDDFLSDLPGAGLAAAPAASTGTALALEALEARMDTLEERIAGMGDTLTASFKATLDEALAGFAASLPQPAPSEPAQDPAPLLEELSTRLGAEIDALRQALPAPLDEDALAQRITVEVLAALPEPQAPVDAQAIVDQTRDMLEERLAAFKEELAALSPQPQAEPLDEEALTRRVTEQVLAALPEQPAVEPQPGVDAQAIVDQTRTMLEERLAAFQFAQPEPQPPGEDLSPRLDALEERLAAQAAPDMTGLATRADLDAMRQDLEAHVAKAIPAAAARVIREEIQALLRDMG